MDHPKQRHGSHTWDLISHYYSCPHCGYISENKDKFEKRFRELEKEMACPRCQYQFTVKKKVQSTLGPFLGCDPEVDE
jgi:rubredoxin